jgi:CheY-like chemotaxis protein
MTKKWADETEKAEHRKPRLLLVDDMGIMLPKLAENLEKQGFEVIKVHLGKDAPSDDKSVLHIATIEDVTKYAMTPANRIDTVVTDLNDRNYPYGRYVVADLAKHKFNGPIAVHSGEPNPEMDANVKAKGAIGLFNKGEPEVIAQAIKQALAECAKAKG